MSRTRVKFLRFVKRVPRTVRHSYGRGFPYGFPPPAGAGAVGPGAGCGVPAAGAAGVEVTGNGIADGCAGGDSGVPGFACGAPAGGNTALAGPGNGVRGDGFVFGFARGFVACIDFAVSARATDATINIDARTTVVRVNAFAAPRPVISPEMPPPVPRPSPPPSERWSKITPIIPTQATTWIAKRTANMTGPISFSICARRGL